MSPVKYVQEAVRSCASQLAANGGSKFELPKNAQNPNKLGYDPVLDTSPNLDLEAASYYLTRIDILM